MGDFPVSCLITGGYVGQDLTNSHELIMEISMSTVVDLTNTEHFLLSGHGSKA